MVLCSQSLWGHSILYQPQISFHFYLSFSFLFIIFSVPFSSHMFLSLGDTLYNHSSKSTAPELCDIQTLFMALLGIVLVIAPSMFPMQL